MQLYYITDRCAFPGNETARQRALLTTIAEAARASVDYIQLREKDLSARDLEQLAHAAVAVVRETRPASGDSVVKTKMLINSRVDIALAAGADGVHLRGDDISPREVVAIRAACGGRAQEGLREFEIAVSCHSLEEVRRADREGATFAVLAPVFCKPGSPEVPSLGLEALKTACAGRLPIFALGGITLENARVCHNAGATGVAGIRLFQNSNIERVAAMLHNERTT